MNLCFQCELEIMLREDELLDFKDCRLGCRAAARVIPAVIGSQNFGGTEHV